jgi:DNA-binding CsgD family transcriptional regulator
MERLAIDAAAARLAVRAYEGASRQDLAQAFQVTTNAIDGRLRRLRRSMGVPKRARLQALLDGVISPPSLKLRSDNVATLEQNEISAQLAAKLRGPLTEFDGGLAALDTCGALRWEDQGCRRLLSSGPTMPVVVARRTRAALSRAARNFFLQGGQRGRQLLHERSDVAVTVLFWPVGLNLVGAQLRQGPLRADEEMAHIEKELELPPAKARAAWMLAQGQTDREVAQALRVPYQTLKGMLTDVYARLDTSERSAAVRKLLQLLRQSRKQDDDI